MKFTSKLTPWADCSRILSTMRTLTVKVDGKTFEEFELSLDGNANATLEVNNGKRKARKAKD